MFGDLVASLVVLVLTLTGTQAAGLETSCSINTAEVVAVQNTRITDLVLIGAGFNAGLRQGMVLGVTRSGEVIAKILLVELRSNASAALIIQLNPGDLIRSGDTAVVQTLKL